MSVLVWQCVCDARIEADVDNQAAALLLVEFLTLHRECPATWRARWYPEREAAEMVAQVERRIGFEVPDHPDEPGGD